MAENGLLGKKFIGRIVKGQDQNQRGMYYVHVPELQPHMAETVGILCTNSIHPTRITNSDRGCFGSYTPLHPGTVVQVECLTDDQSSLRIVKIVSDDQNKTDMSPGKILGVEPSGKIIQVKVDGVPEKRTDPLDETKQKLNGLLNSGTEEAKSLLGSIKDLIGGFLSDLGDFFSDMIPKKRSVSRSLNLSLDAFDINKAKEEFKKIESQANKNLTTNANNFKVNNGIVTYDSSSNSKNASLTSAKDLLSKQSDPKVYQQYLTIMKDQRAQSLGVSNFDSLPEDKKQQIALELGVSNENKFINAKKSTWEKNNAGKLYNVFSTGNNTNEERPEYQYGEGTKKPKLDERDEQYTVLITPNKTGVYVNEKTENDPESFYIVYRGKETAFRINDGGIHISTDHNFFQKISVNNDIVIDGTSSITVNGGNYDIYVNGNTNLYAKGDINQYSEKDINIRAAKNISLQAGIHITALAGNEIITLSGGDSSFVSKAEMNIQSSGQMQQLSKSNLKIGSNSNIHIKANSKIAADGSQIYLNSGHAQKPAELNIEEVPTPVASPAKRDVCKI